MLQINPYQSMQMWNNPWAGAMGGAGQSQGQGQGQSMLGDLLLLGELEELLEGGGAGQCQAQSPQGCPSQQGCPQSQQPMPGCFPGAAQPQQPQLCGCLPQSCAASPTPPPQPCQAAQPAQPAPASQPGTVTQPAEHYSIGSDFSGPTTQSTTFTQGQNGTVDETTQYTDGSGHYYNDQGVWDPSTGVLTNNESNDQGQNALVTTQVVNGQIVSNVSGNTGVSQCVVGFNGTNNATETITNSDGTSQTEDTTGSNGGPWGTYQMNTPDTVVQKNINDGGPTTTTINETYPQASTVSTWV